MILLRAFGRINRFYRNCGVDLVPIKKRCPDLLAQAAGTQKLRAQNMSEEIAVGSHTGDPQIIRLLDVPLASRRRGDEFSTLPMSAFPHAVETSKSLSTKNTPLHMLNLSYMAHMYTPHTITYNDATLTLNPYGIVVTGRCVNICRRFLICSKFLKCSYFSKNSSCFEILFNVVKKCSCFNHVQIFQNIICK